MKTSYFKIFSTIACTLLTSLSADYSCCQESSDCCDTIYEIYGTCVYLQPEGSNLYYGVEAIGLDPNIAVPAASPNWKILEIDPDYHAGFEVGTRMLCQNSGINVDLRWERLHAHDSHSFTVPVNTSMVGPFFDIGPNSASYKVAHGTASSQFDEVNLNFGKRFCICDDFYTNVYLGVGFARIRQTIESTFSNVANTISRNIKSPSTFTGAGPEVGVQYFYRLCDNFAFTGGSNVALFMGRLKNSTTYTTYTPELAQIGNPEPNVQKTSVPNRDQLVPGFEQKLGLAYSVCLCGYNVSLEFGYQAQIYVNAVQTVDMTAPQVLPTGAVFDTQVGVFAVGFERTLSNYMLTGPYGTLSIAF